MSTLDEVSFESRTRSMTTTKHLSATTEQSRRDDLDALGISLLSLLHVKLPWDSIQAPDLSSKLLHVGHMKEGKAFEDLLSRSPKEFKAYFDHCRSLAFDEKPDYALLKTLFRERMTREKWSCDPETYDWMGKVSLPYGTVEPDEYKFEILPCNREPKPGKMFAFWKFMWMDDKIVD